MVLSTAAAVRILLVCGISAVLADDVLNLAMSHSLLELLFLVLILIIGQHQLVGKRCEVTITEGLAAL